jgi:maltooligosyltrehalose trehalohydrolase
MVTEPHLGAVPLPGNACRFRVWAPKARRVEVHLLGAQDRFIPLHPAEHGYHQASIENVPPGTLYRYRLDGDKERPDPVSRFQPEGVHGPSAVVDLAFDWQSTGWHGLPLQHYVIYELHVGTFTPEGTYDAIIPYLDSLCDLGVTAIELMPIAQFPGNRNWGYDGVGMFAAQNSYGGPAGLKRLVDACHHRGLAVVLDVVYNHLGPEGNYLWDYGPYFTDQHRTPWGPAVNFDCPHSDEVRRFFLENVIQWLRDFRIDALRLDAIHAIRDDSAIPILQEMSETVADLSIQLNRRIYLIAESNLNDVRQIRPREQGGIGLDSQWSDDLHHCIHTLLTGERDGYYADFGTLDLMARAFRTGYAYSGQYSPFRRRRHGNSPEGFPPWQFVVCSQNHDQIGNRMLGDRLTKLLSFDALKVAAAAVILSPFTPMLFMGEEYGEPAPFQFFTSHGDAHLVEAVRKGRREEFADFAWQGEVPDPQDDATFARCKLQHKLAEQGKHKILRDFYKELLRLRKSLPILTSHARTLMQAVGFEEHQVLYARRTTNDDAVTVLFNMGKQKATITLPIPPGRWRCVLDSQSARWQGSAGWLSDELRSNGEVAFEIPGHTAALLQREETRQE